MRKLRILAGVLIFGCLGLAGLAHADAVADWNGIAVQTVNAAVPPRPGPTGVLDLAVVHAAVYDAVEAIDGRFRPYHVEIPGASGSPEAAAAKAAHDVLVNHFPAQAALLDMTYHDYLANHWLAEDDPGVLVGAQAAAGIIALRANDGSFPPGYPPFIGGTDPGVWRPTPPAFAPMAAPWLGAVTPFTLKSPSQYRAKTPPDLTSRQYARDYDEVKALGALSGSARTDEQTYLAHFWSANYLVLWNQALRDIADAHLHDIGDSARLFALADLAVADAVITAWDTKKHYVFWRPLTAIQEGDNDGNPKTAGDPDWQPLYTNPPYPDYTSGANNFTGAVTRALALFFGRDEMTFSVRSTNPVAVPQMRMYDRFSDAAAEVVDARIYEGIHFRFADEEARKQGRHVAQWAFGHFLRPVDDDDGEEE